MTEDRDTLTDEEREQIDAACIADWKRGWSGIHPDRHNINAAVESIVAARVRAAQAQTWDEACEFHYREGDDVEWDYEKGEAVPGCDSNPYRSEPGDEFQNPED